MKNIEHRLEAERILSTVNDYTNDSYIMVLIAQAQVHATLALGDEPVQTMKEPPNRDWAKTEPIGLQADEIKTVIDVALKSLRKNLGNFK